ncbi:non-canonical purine NTP pyrophosphatase, RdgB/HAM1 family [Opitutaceae bacterium EW11]|nr:non-canonical purine NTP pyrophosphatase, RdgB/HAM1 family [Opitutaceae bacterium EW11]
MKLYLASGNAHKAQEFQALADASGAEMQVLSARSLGGMPSVVEDTGTFVGNARKKAHALRVLAPADAWVLADDSGLCVDALSGAPGVESAYYAGPQSDGAANLAKLLHVLRDVPGERRRAHFVCVLVLLSPTGKEQIFEGRCNGTLAEEARGDHGFGYDPIFIPDGRKKSLAEMSEAQKNALSHRARAWMELRKALVG